MTLATFWLTVKVKTLESSSYLFFFAVFFWLYRPDRLFQCREAEAWPPFWCLFHFSPPSPRARRWFKSALQVGIENADRSSLEECLRTHFIFSPSCFFWRLFSSSYSVRCRSANWQRVGRGRHVFSCPPGPLVFYLSFPFVKCRPSTEKDEHLHLRQQQQRRLSLCGRGRSVKDPLSPLASVGPSLLPITAIYNTSAAEDSDPFHRRYHHHCQQRHQQHQLGTQQKPRFLFPIVFHRVSSIGWAGNWFRTLLYRVSQSFVGSHGVFFFFWRLARNWMMVAKRSNYLLTPLKVTVHFDHYFPLFSSRIQNKKEGDTERENQRLAWLFLSVFVVWTRRATIRESSSRWFAGEKLRVKPQWISSVSIVSLRVLLGVQGFVCVLLTFYVLLYFSGS